MGSWRDEPPTPNQVALLDRWGVNPIGLTKGDASDIITQEIAQRKAGYDYPEDYEGDDYDPEVNYPDPFKGWD